MAQQVHINILEEDLPTIFWNYDDGGSVPVKWQYTPSRPISWCNKTDNNRKT